MITGAVPPARAQISLASAVDLAIRNSPRVQSTEADVARAQAALNESKDVFIPAVTAGASLGQAYGYSNYPPTLFNISATSLIYSASQPFYIKSTRAGLEAARKSLEDIREVVAEDAALTFVALDHDQARAEVLGQQTDLAAKLLQIVQDRFDAGVDSRMDVLDARLTVANLHLATLRTQQALEDDRMHLARLMGIPPGSLRADGGFPSTPVTAADAASGDEYANASVASAFLNAHAKELQAKGDAKFLYRPQVSLASQFNRYATFTNAWHNIEQEYSTGTCEYKNGCDPLGANETLFGVSISIPLLDRGRRERALETAAEANKALHDAEFAQVNVLDAQGRFSHSLEVLRAQADVASIEQQRAQEQLSIVQTRMATEGVVPPASPKDEQNARIAERDKYLALIDANFTLHQSEISLLRQSGRLIVWLSSAGTNSPQIQPSTPQSHP